MENNNCTYQEKLWREALARVEQKIEGRLDAMDNALILYRADMARNMEHLNQVRQEVLADRSNFVTLATFRTHVDLSESNARTIWIAIVGWVLAIVGLISAVVAKMI